MKNSLSILLFCSAATALGCSSELGAGGGGGADGGQAGSPDAAIGDPSCGAQTENIPLVEINEPPDLLIVLDKSGSMNEEIFDIDFPFPFTKTRWEIMKEALVTITSQYETNIRFGISTFPEAGVCGITAGANVDVGLSRASAINSYMDSTSATGNTPAHFALQDAASIYAGMPSNPAGRYVLFATDGLPNCGGAAMDQGSDAETVASVAALASEGINTFVVGFGGFLNLDTGILNDAAQAGGEARPSAPFFYEADDAASLDAALLEIAGGIILPSCTFEITETPPNPDLVTVSVAGTPIPRDSGHNNGWDYHPDASQITFFGAACDAVQQGETSISFVFGCPGPVIE